MATARLALVPYEADTEVVSIEEEPRMQVLLLDEDGELLWHRPLEASGDSEIACGGPIDYREVKGRRPAQYAGKMCPICFTDRELVKAELANIAARRK
jgi:hypothetical protein